MTVTSFREFLAFSRSWFAPAVRGAGRRGEGGRGRAANDPPSGRHRPGIRSPGADDLSPPPRRGQFPNKSTMPPFLSRKTEPAGPDMGALPTGLVPMKEMSLAPLPPRMATSYSIGE